MNELQQVLLIFAIIVVVTLYWLQQRKNKQAEKNAQSVSTSPASAAPKEQADHALNELGEAHIPISSKTEHRLGLDEDVVETVETVTSTEPVVEKAVDPNPSEVPDNQLGLGFDEPEISVPAATEEGSTKSTNQSEKKSRHIVIEDSDMTPVAGYEETGEIPVEAETVPGFGIPKNQPPASSNTNPSANVRVETTEPQVFVIIVMGTEEYPWPKVNQTLQGVGLKPSKQSIFVKHDSMGNEIIKVANLLEPGVFPVEEPTNSEFKTPGVVMILELPTTVKAPAVMHDMIMMARKISQRLNGRMYNAERHLIKESDLQQMRDAAVAYESEAL